MGSGTDAAVSTNTRPMLAVWGLKSQQMQSKFRKFSALHMNVQKWKAGLASCSSIHLKIDQPLQLECWTPDLWTPLSFYSTAICRRVCIIKASLVRNGWHFRRRLCGNYFPEMSFLKGIVDHTIMMSQCSGSPPWIESPAIPPSKITAVYFPWRNLPVYMLTLFFHHDFYAVLIVKYMQPLK